MPQENERLETRHVGPKNSNSYQTFPHLTFLIHYRTRWNATPATENNMTTCLATLEHDIFSIFRYRHGGVTGNERLATRHLDAEKNFLGEFLQLKFGEHHQTGWNVRKCHVCHAKQDDNLFGNIRKKYTLSNRLECHKVPCLPRKTGWQLPWKLRKPQTERTHRNTRDSRQDTLERQKHNFVRDFRQFSQLATWRKDKFAAPGRHSQATGISEKRDEAGGSIKTNFSRETSSICTPCSCKIDVFLRVFLRTWKLQPQNRFFVRGFRQFSAHHRNATPTWCSPSNAKVLRLPRNCNKSSDNVTKVLRLPRKTTFDTFQNTSECHEVPRLPPPLQNFP